MVLMLRRLPGSGGSRRYPAALGFRELAQDEVIGALAERNYSYHGLTNIPRLMQESAPQWAQMLKDDGVDAVFLIPG